MKSEKLDAMLFECEKYFDKKYKTNKEYFGHGGSHIRRKFKACRDARKYIKELESKIRQAELGGDS